MLYIVNFSHDAYFNLALEEYLLQELDTGDDCLMLWQNRPAVVVGRNQNTWDEVNLDFVESHKTAVVRRLTGGGAVYHDLGNLNFSLILKNQPGSSYDFARFLEPVVDILKGLGLDAEIDGRNDITIGGKKVSGNSQYRLRDRILHHGTLMFDVNFDHLEEALRVSPDKIARRGVASVRSRVTNIKEHLTAPVEMREFRKTMKKSLLAAFGSEGGDYFLSSDNLLRVRELQKNKYSTWEWNFGASPYYNIRKSRRFPWGKLELLLDVRAGIITRCKIYGDFFGRDDLLPLEQALEQKPFLEEEIRAVLNDLDPGEYIAGLSKEMLCQLLFD